MNALILHTFVPSIYPQTASPHLLKGFFIFSGGVYIGSAIICDLDRCATIRTVRSLIAVRHKPRLRSWSLTNY